MTPLSSGVVGAGAGPPPALGTRRHTTGGAPSPQSGHGTLACTRPGSVLASTRREHVRHVPRTRIGGVLAISGPARRPGGRRARRRDV